MLHHTAIREQSLLLFGKSKFSNRWAWPLLGTNEVQNKKIVGMWLVGQFNVSGHAQPTFIEELGAPY